MEGVLRQRGFMAKAIQGDMTQAARTDTIEKFRSGALSIMVATDVASRGLDIPDIDLVVNFTFPLTIEDFVHRVGRTARGARTGKAVTFFSAAEDKLHAFDLVRVLRDASQPVPAELSNLADNTFSATKKKAHPVYGNHFRSEQQMKQLEAKKVHVTFNDSDDEE